MQQFVPCDGCGNQIPTPEIREGEPASQFLNCEACGKAVYWDIITQHEDSNEAIADSPLLELELDSELKLELRVADSIGDEESSPYHVQLALSQSTPDWSLLEPTVPRRSPREVSAIRKIVPPILGGLAAFPIATLIMWYGFGKDIGSTGPTVAHYVPWIVPQKLRVTPWEEGIFQPQGNIATNSTASQPVDETVVANPAISETIATLRTLQKEWNNTPEADRVKMVGEYNSAITQLSEQAAELKGRSATVWRKELETIAREILVHPKVPKVIQLGPIGKLPGVPEASNGDFIATVVKIGEDNEPAPNDSWSLNETWSSGKVEIPIEIMPGAWRAGAATLPKTCLLFGKLVANESSQPYIVLKVHAVLPQ